MGLIFKQNYFPQDSFINEERDCWRALSLTTRVITNPYGVGGATKTFLSSQNEKINKIVLD